MNYQWKDKYFLKSSQQNGNYFVLTLICPLIVAKWHHRSWSTLVQVMASCLMEPSHFLIQCWLIISKIIRKNSSTLSPWILCSLPNMKSSDEHYISLNWHSFFPQAPVLPLWCHMMTRILVNIFSANGMSADQCQAITWTNADFIVNWTLRNKPLFNLNQNINILF